MTIAYQCSLETCTEKKISEFFLFFTGILPQYQNVIHEARVSVHAFKKVCFFCRCWTVRHTLFNSSIHSLRTSSITFWIARGSVTLAASDVWGLFSTWLTDYPCKSFGLKFIPNQSDLFRNLFPRQSELIRVNPKKVFNLVWCNSVKNQSVSIRDFESEWIRTNLSILMNPRSEFFGLIRIEYSV